MELELVFNWVIKSSMMASMLAVLILLVNYALRNKLDAKWQYAIWMLLILRLLIPYDIQSPWSIYSLIPNKSVISPIVDQIRIPDSNAQIDNISGKDPQLTNDQSIINQQSSTKAEEPLAKDLSIGWILAMLWLVGVLILMILTIATNLRFHLLVRREPFVSDERMSKLMQECTRKMGIRRNLPIIITNHIDTPCLYAIVGPKLLLPQSLVNRLNDENIRHIFIHELSHYKRKDILINWLAVAAQIVHWFNPLIWYSFARMREDCELACDADTLCCLMPEEYQSYGLSIISLLTPAQSTWHAGTTGFFGNKNNDQIKKRIRMIKFFNKPTSKWTWTAVVIFISLGLVGFTNSISNATPAKGVGTEIINGGQAIGSTKVIDPSSVITIEDITGPNYKGKVMLIEDPKRVKLAVTKEIGITGKRVSDLVKDMGAIAGINAGGFYDPNGKGNGAFPDGLTIQNGKVVHNNMGSKAMNIAGFDNQGKLIIGNMTADQAQQKHIQDAVTFGPNLIAEGKSVISGDGGWGMAPRTGIGQMADGTVIFVVIDGRQPSWSMGATLSDLANVFVDYHAINAVNLDGGSSSEMFYQGKVLNKIPNIVGERYIPTAFVVTS